MKIPPWVEKKMQVTQKTRRLYDKALCHCLTSQPLTMRMLAKPPHMRLRARVTSSMATGRMNKSARGRKAFPCAIRELTTMPMVGNLVKLPTKSAPLCLTWKSTGVFKPLDTIANPLGLCQFYHTDPAHSNVITGPKSAASTHKIKHLLEKVRNLGQSFTIVVFEGSNITLLGLLQELLS